MIHVFGLLLPREKSATKMQHVLVEVRRHPTTPPGACSMARFLVPKRKQKTTQHYLIRRGTTPHGDNHRDAQPPPLFDVQKDATPTQDCSKLCPLPGPHRNKPNTMGLHAAGNFSGVSETNEGRAPRSGDPLPPTQDGAA